MDINNSALYAVCEAEIIEVQFAMIEAEDAEYLELASYLQDLESQLDSLMH